MRIAQIKVENFRSLRQLTVSFDPYTCLVGPNGSGKSAIIKCLNLFFHQGPDGPESRHKITAEDFYLKNTDTPIRIEVLFVDLSPDAKSDLQDYVRNDELRVMAEIRINTSDGQVVYEQHGMRMVMDDLRAYFVADKDGAGAPTLRGIYADLRQTYPDLPKVTSKADMQDALRSYESARPELCVPIPSTDQFYGFTSGKDRLEKYIQWVYVPAVKDATTEEAESRNTALGQLLQRTVRASVDFGEDIENLTSHVRDMVEDIMDRQQSTLDGISARLNERLVTWSHPDASMRLQWQEDPAKSVRIEQPHAAVVAREGSFEGQIGRFGHGLQRSFLLALLQELAQLGDTGPTLVLGCEEPELYQHPPQARYLASVLRTLAANGEQMIVTTHDPNFVAADQPETVRLCRIDRSTSSTRVAQTSVEEITRLHAKVIGVEPEKMIGARARIYAALQSSISDIFFAHRVILVEGNEDYAYIETYLHLLDLKDEFRRLGCHIVAVNGKGGLIRPLTVCRKLGIHAIVVFDSDADRQNGNPGEVDRDRRENLAILRLSGHRVDDPFPGNTIWGDSVVAWKSNIGDVVMSDIGRDGWAQVMDECALELGPASELRKNPLFIAEVLRRAWDRELKSCNLEKLCRVIVRDN